MQVRPSRCPTPTARSKQQARAWGQGNIICSTASRCAAAACSAARGATTPPTTRAQGGRQPLPSLASSPSLQRTTHSHTNHAQPQRLPFLALAPHSLPSSAATCGAARPVCSKHQARGAGVWVCGVLLRRALGARGRRHEHAVQTQHDATACSRVRWPDHARRSTSAVAPSAMTSSTAPAPHAEPSPGPPPTPTSLMDLPAPWRLQLATSSALDAATRLALFRTCTFYRNMVLRHRTAVAKFNVPF